MYRGRFAPSPTGSLHFGSLVAALGSWLFARARGGRWLLRIEDLDPPRTVPGSAQAIIAALAAFGLVSDEPILRQSERGACYRDALRRLQELDVVYPCWCSRADLETTGGRHPTRCVSTAGLRQPAWRLRVGAAQIEFDDAVQGRFHQNLAREVGDFVIWRADGVCSYQLAVVVDDAAQRISEVVRGADLLDSTPRQILLRRVLDLPQPSWVHLPLALDEAGLKLSKQSAAQAVDPTQPLPALRAALAFLGQREPRAEAVPALLAAAAAGFDPQRIPRRKGIVAASFAALRKDATPALRHNSASLCANRSSSS